MRSAGGGDFLYNDTMSSFPVLYEDPSCLVINKPAGIAVHTGNGMALGEQTVIDAFPEEYALVHRLDKETSGCLLIAKNLKAHEALQQQFQDRTVEKSYLALVAGVPDPPKAVIDAPIGRKISNRTKMSILGAAKSRQARTTYATLQSTDACTLLQCDLHTGRTHQIRVHLSGIEHPILGDATYQSSESERLTNQYEIDGLCLHAWKLAFDSPGGDRIKIEAPISDSFKNNLQKLKITFSG